MCLIMVICFSPILLATSFVVSKSLMVSPLGEDDPSPKYNLLYSIFQACQRLHKRQPDLRLRPRICGIRLVPGFAQLWSNR